MTDVLGIDSWVLNQALEFLPDAALSCDEGGRILGTNREARCLLRLDSRELAGMGLGVFLPAVAEWVESDPFLDLVRSGGLDSEQPLVDASGNEHLVWLRSRLLARNREGSRFVLVTVRDVTNRNQDEQRLREMAVTDELTGLHNRRYLDSTIDFEVERARRYGYMLCCVFIDLDRFKHINDEYGHHVGDLALKHVANRLRGACRKVDTLVRWGGDEFVVLALTRDWAGAQRLVERINEAVCVSPLRLGGNALHLGFCCGASVGNIEIGQTPSAMLEHADSLLRQGKAAGRGRCLVELYRGA
jgi:diguanylate cyclase (GGDEF)-like protein/PAS domain S-box-containing protein